MPQDRDRQPWEVTVAGSGAHDDDFENGSAGVALGAGYYFNEVFELSARQNAQFSDTEAGPDLWDFQSRIALDLHFPLESFVPFIGGNVGYVYGDTVADTWVAGPEAGIKLYLKDDAFLLGMVEWAFFFDEDESLDAAFDDGVIIYTLGIGLRF